MWKASLGSILRGWCENVTIVNLLITRKELVALFDKLDKGILKENQELADLITAMHLNRYILAVTLLDICFGRLLVHLNGC